MHVNCAPGPHELGKTGYDQEEHRLCNAVIPSLHELLVYSPCQVQMTILSKGSPGIAGRSFCAEHMQYDLGFRYRVVDEVIR